MKKQKTKPEHQKLPKGFTMNPELADKYSNEPFFKEKLAKANEIIRVYGLPKFDSKD